MTQVSSPYKRNTHDDGNEACIGVVRYRAKEIVLVHVRCGKERGAGLVHDNDNLHTISAKFTNVDTRER